MFESLDFHGGKVTHDTPGLHTHIGAHRIINHLTWDLREDMFQVHYPGKILIDVGWHPISSDKWMVVFSAANDNPASFTEDMLLEQGHFQISLIKDRNWFSDEMPAYQCQSFEELETGMIQAIQTASRWKLTT